MKSKLIFSLIFSLILISSLSFISAGNWTSNLDKDFIACWNFDEQDMTGSGSILDRNGVYNGTNDGADNITGKFNTSYNYVRANTDTILIPDFPNLTTDITLSWWGYVDDKNTGTYAVSKNPTFQFQISGGSITFEGRGASVVHTIGQGGWEHYVGRYNGTHISLTINGTIITSAASSTAVSSSNIFSLGVRASGVGGSTYYDGRIDDLIIWNRSLSDIEVAAIWDSGTGTPCAYPSGAPKVTLNSPSDNVETINSTINFNTTVTTLLGNLDNVTLFIDDVGIETNTSGIEGEYIFTRILDPQTSTWLVQGCNSIGCVNSSSRNLTISKIIQDDLWYNTTSYETAQEKIIVDIRANSSLTAVSLEYNGTSYTLTKSGTNYSKTFDMPFGEMNRTFRFKYTYAGTNTYSDYYYQNISLIYFNKCNASATTPFLNLTFKDENSLAWINASIPISTFVYWLGSGAINKTYTYATATEYNNYTFCSNIGTQTLNVDSIIQYKSTGYPQRIYDPDTLEYTSTLTNKTLYLLGTADGIYVTWQVVNAADQVISGVQITLTREIDSEEVTVANGVTDASGTTTLWLNPDFEHNIVASKTGYTSYTASLFPTQTGYTITLGGAGDSVPISKIKGITYNLYPTNSSLTNDTTYTFGISLESSYWDIEKYGFNLRFRNGTVISGGTTTTEGSLVSLNYNTGNETRIFLDYFWVIDSTYTNGTVDWNIYNTEYTQWSIKTFFVDLNNYLDSGFFGLDNFGRNLLIFLFLFITVGIMGYKFGLNSPLFVSGLIFFTVFFLDVAVGIIPAIVVLHGNAIEYLLTFVSGLIFVISVLSEVNK